MTSDSEEELFPIEYYTRHNNTFMYEDPLLLTGILRAVVEGNHEKVVDLVKSGKSVNINDNNGNTPLHIAVIKNNLLILKFLLLQDEIVINTRNFLGETPLFHASKLGRYDCVQILIDAGANVNLPNYEEITPLHVSIGYPKIAHMLILKGANLNVCDYSGDMPLHDAVAEQCFETVCMFLYYNADADALGGNDLTPFMKAMIGEDKKIEEILFDYVTNFELCSGDQISILELALIHLSPNLRNIIKKNVTISSNALFLCLRFSEPDVFKLLWDRLEYDEYNPISINQIIDSEYVSDNKIEKYIDIIIESPNTNLLLKSFSKDAFSLFIDTFFKRNCNLNQLTKLTCVLLENSFILQSTDIYKIFCYYGYCELIKLLLFMEYKGSWLPFMLTCRLFFDIKNSIDQTSNQIKHIQISIPILEHQLFKRDILNYLEYCVDRQLIDKYGSQYLNSDVVNVLPKIPTLIQLARDAARDYLVQQFQISNTCQYYTLINHLNIAHVYKMILKFEKKLYNLR